MQSNYYPSIFNQVHLGFAFHQIITDSNGKPIDYLFLEVNQAFEKLTGLKASDVVGNKASAVLKGPEDSELGRISLYGKIALNGGKGTTAIYSEQLRRWYQVEVISPEKGFFATIFSDASNQYLMAEASKELGQYTADNINYTSIARRIQDISGADYCIINVFKKNSKDSTTVAVSGIEKNIAKAVSLLGFNIVGKSWKHDPAKEEKIRHSKITVFPSLSELVGNILPGNFLPLFETIFNLGDAVVVRTTKDDVSIGDITLLFNRNKHLQNPMLVEAFADITGSTISRIAAESALKESEQQAKCLFDNAADAVFVAEKDTGVIIDANQSAAQLMKLPLEKIIGMHQTQLHPSEIGNSVEEKFTVHKQELSAKSHTLPTEARVLRSDGVEVPVEILASELEYKGKTCLMGTFRDISKRKHVEQYLDQTKLTYENMVNSLTEAIYILDEKGLFIEVNNGATKMYGYSREELIGQSPQTVAAPGMNDLDAIKKKSAQVSETGNPARFEFWAKRKNGEIFPKDVILNKGKYFGKDVVIAVARDISKIKKTENTLIESKLKFQNLIELAVDGILIGSHDGNIIQINSRLCTMIGISSDKLIGKPVNSLPFTSDSLLNNPLRFDLLQKGETTISERRMMVSGGGIIDIEMRSKMMPDKTYQSIIIDITERKKLENTQKIILEISQLSLLHNSLHSFLAAIHQKVNKIIRTNNFYVALYQTESNTYSFPYYVDEKNELAPDTFHDLSGSFTDYVRKNGKVLLRRGIGIDDPDRKIPLADIGDVPLVWLGLPLIIGPHDEAIGVMAVQDYHNFEAYNEVEITILELMANKIGVFIERVKNFEDLRKAKEKAEESDRLKSAFLMNMSHEIRTPMNGILGFIDLLENPDIDKESRKTYLGVVNKSGQRLLNTINDIIEISRIEAGEVHVKIEDVNIEEVMQSQYNFFKPQADEKNLRFQLAGHVVGKAAIIKTDKHKLEGILTNLIKNAIKFTSQGVIEIGNKIENDRMEFWVSDSGRGIPAERLDAVFDQFVQAELAITRAHEGSGLGLSIVKTYVEALDGKILVQSEEGKGSTFRVSIPYKTSKKPSPPNVEANTEDKSIPKGLTILLAEDDEVSYQLLKIILTRSGFSIIRTINGEDTVKALREDPTVALILMDIKMPGMDGLEATKQIRQFNKTIPIIAQTAHAFVGENEKAKQAGCNDYVSKPITKEKLMDVMKQYLEKDFGKR